jgi:hypothetical protein
VAQAAAIAASVAADDKSDDAETMATLRARVVLLERENKNLRFVFVGEALEVLLASLIVACSI